MHTRCVLIVIVCTSLCERACCVGVHVQASSSQICQDRWQLSIAPQVVIRLAEVGDDLLGLLEHLDGGRGGGLVEMLSVRLEDSHSGWQVFG